MPRLLPNSVKIYIAMFDRVKNDRNTVQISTREIQTVTGIASFSTVNKSLTELYEARLVEVLIPGKFRGDGETGHAATYKLLR